MRGKKLYKYLPNFIFTVVVAFWIVITIFVNSFSYVFLDPNKYTDLMSKYEVDKLVYSEINDYFDRQSAYTGISAEVFTSSLNNVEVSAAVFAYVDSTFDYMKNSTDVFPEFSYDFTSMEINVTQAYVDWAQENDIEQDEQFKSGVDTTIANVKNVVLTKLDIMMLSHLNGENGISTKIRRVYPNLTLIRLATVAVLLILIVIYNFINKKHKSTIVYWFATSIFCSGLMFVVPCAILKHTKYFDGLILKYDAIYKSLTQSLYNFLDIYIQIGGVLVAISAIMYFIFVIRKQNR